MIPIHGELGATIGPERFNENLLCYLQFPGTGQTLERFGKEHLVCVYHGNVHYYQGQFNPTSIRYIKTSEDGTAIACLQGVTYDDTTFILSNIYTRPDYRSQGHMTHLFEILYEMWSSIETSAHFSKSGFRFVNQYT